MFVEGANPDCCLILYDIIIMFDIIIKLEKGRKKTRKKRERTKKNRKRGYKNRERTKKRRDKNRERTKRTKRTQRTKKTEKQSKTEKTLKCVLKDSIRIVVVFIVNINIKISETVSRYRRIDFWNPESRIQNPETRVQNNCKFRIGLESTICLNKLLLLYGSRLKVTLG